MMTGRLIPADCCLRLVQGCTKDLDRALQLKAQGAASVKEGSYNAAAQHYSGTVAPHLLLLQGVITTSPAKTQTCPAALLPCRCPHVAAGCEPASRSSQAALKQSPVPVEACNRCSSSSGLEALCWQPAACNRCSSSSGLGACCWQPAAQQQCLAAAGSCCRR